MTLQTCTDFLTGPAAGWVQAIGSIGAILGSYHLGGADHRRAQVRQQIDELYRSKHKQSVLLEVFKFAEAVDLAVQSYCETETLSSWRPIKALAEDLLAQCSSLPFFELPEPDQIREIQLIRQAALTYIGYSTSIIDLGEQAPDFYARVIIFANESLIEATNARKRSQEYLEQLEHGINKLKVR